MRPSARAANELRPIKITRNYIKHADGSVLIESGDTRVICTASVENSVPGFLRGKGCGWVTAEYGMLPTVQPAVACGARPAPEDRGGAPWKSSV